jgi:hypothetical protein
VLHEVVYIIRIIDLLLPRLCPGILAALKPENMRPFYASLEIVVLTTIEAIRLVIQIPLRTERRTYLIHAPVPLLPGYPNLLSGRRRNEFYV